MLSRRIVAAVAVGALVVAATVADARAGHRVRGSVLMPTQDRCDDLAFATVTAYWASRTNGVSHFFFRVDPATQGEPFKLTSLEAGADPDISFVGGSGSRTFETAGRSEAGTVPKGATFAWVCARAGADMDFLYVAGR